LLSKINSKKQKIKVEIFYGLKGMKTAYSKEFEYDKKGKTVRIMGARGTEFSERGLYDFFINNIYPKRIASKVTIKKIYSEDSRVNRDKYEKEAKIRYLPYNSPVTFLVIENLTIMGIQSKEENITISIESLDVAESFIQQFELMWKIAKK